MSPEQVFLYVGGARARKDDALVRYIHVTRFDITSAILSKKLTHLCLPDKDPPLVGSTVVPLSHAAPF